MPGYTSNTMPPYYPAELIHKMFHSTTEQLVRIKIEDYKLRHNGKGPARIFVSDNMFLELVSCVRCNVQTTSTGEHTMFGIPVSIFNGNGTASIYLSDEKEDQL